MINLSMFKIAISMITIFLNLITLSFMNLYNMWFMMEISSMSMISLLMINDSKKMSITYFIISFISSSILVLSISLFYMTNFMEMNSFIMMCFILSLMLKMGFIPFHMWMINLADDFNWWNLFIMLMFMKIIPIYFISQFLSNLNMIITYILMMNMFLSSLMALNLLSLKKIMIFSSINQSTLLMLLMFLNMNLFLMYFIMYLISTYMLFLFLNYLNINNKNMLINLSTTKVSKIVYMMLVVTYSNLPPMFTFMMKWSVLENLINFNSSMVIMMMLIMISSLIMTWNYLNLNNLNYYLVNSKLNFNTYISYDHSFGFMFLVVMLFSLFSFLTF